MAEKAKVGFVGLGVMGYPMAGHLQSAGYDVTVYNRTAAKAEAWVTEYGGTRAATPRAAAGGAGYVLSCVGADDDVREIAYGDDGILAGLDAGAVFADHTTASAELAREMAAAAADRDIGFLDAPVSGGQAGAENGQLTVMVGGAADTYEKIKPVFDVYSKMCDLIGPSGAGQQTKMVNQICIAGLVQGLAEGLNLGQKAGLDMEKVVAVISKGAAQSWQMENRWQTMLENKFDFGFAVDWMRKDLGICLAEAERIDARLPTTALIDQFYANVQARGGKRWDTSSLFHLLAND